MLTLSLLFFCFFVNYTATTEISTYSHTLSLHDARPILSLSYQQTLSYLYSCLPMFHRVGPAAYKPDLSNTIRICDALGNPENKFRSIHIARSEEHTSELQSLMRNSYAAFCLKKIKTNNHANTIHL